MLLDLLPRLAQLLPVADLGDDGLALGADCLSGDAEVVAQLAVAKRLARGLGEWPADSRVLILGAGEDLGEVDGACSGALAREAAADLQQA